MAFWWEIQEFAIKMNEKLRFREYSQFNLNTHKKDLIATYDLFLLRGLPLPLDASCGSALPVSQANTTVVGCWSNDVSEDTWGINTALVLPWAKGMSEEGIIATGLGMGISTVFGWPWVYGRDWTSLGKGGRDEGGLVGNENITWSGRHSAMTCI